MATEADVEFWRDVRGAIKGCTQEHHTQRRNLVSDLTRI